MMPQRHERISEIFAAVLELDSDAQDHALERECIGDPSLRRDVEALLSNHARAGGFLRSPALGSQFAVETSPQRLESFHSLLGRRIGKYELRRMIAVGGMGAVFEAVQSDPQRVVALKVMRQGLSSTSARRRFEYESQILARLRHPNIGQVYDAGHSDEGAGGVPFFAMELVPDALSITRFASVRNLDTKPRLEMFIKVCEAVHHGHQRGIIHRDLKPGNILVDSLGEPKVIDFGIAKAADAALTQTFDANQLLGTLQYMSPERFAVPGIGAADSELDIDTRSDVYGLGVVLYELLCGQVPYSVDNLSLPEAMCIIHEQAPMPPSVHVASLRGDLETIVLKAIQKAPAGRYSSTSDLAADIRRFLNHEPITARPASAMYQLRRFARRHRAIGSAAAAGILALVLGIIATSWQAVRATRAERHATMAKRDLSQVVRFQESMLTDVDLPAMGLNMLAQVRNQVATLQQHNTTGAAESSAVEASASPMAAFDTLTDRVNPIDLARNVMADNLLQRAIAAMDRQFKDQPLIEASLRESLAQAYRQIGLAAESIAQLQWALDAYSVSGPDSLDAARVLHAMSNTLVEIGHVDDVDKAEECVREALRIRRTILGDEHPTTLASQRGLGKVLYFQHRYAEAETHLRKVLEQSRAILGDQDIGTIWTMEWIAINLQAQGRFQDAQDWLVKVVDWRRRTMPEDTETLAAIMTLTRNLFALGRLNEAESLGLECFQRTRTKMGWYHPRTLRCLGLLFEILDIQGRGTELEPEFREGLGYFPPSPAAAYYLVVPEAMTRLAHILLEKRTIEATLEAESILRQAIDLKSRAIPPGSIEWVNYVATSELSEAQIDQAENLWREDRAAALEKLAEAERLLLTICESSHSLPPDIALQSTALRRKNEALHRLVVLYEAWHTAEPDQGYDLIAREWQAKLPNGAASAGTASPAEATAKDRQ